jgi:hypothetical protein
MLKIRSKTLPRVLDFVAGLLILKVTAAVMWNYHNYFPPNFDTDFLRGRQDYFAGSYHWAFYVHIVAGPPSLVLGLALISERFRMRFPKWHRYLGRFQALNVLFLLAPSGLWMAFRAQSGPIAGVGFAVLAILTGTTLALGWRTAVKRKFAVHRRWMWRCFLLLCSTVVLRLTAGLVTVTGIQATWIDPLSAWASWLVPLAAFELSGVVKRATRVAPQKFPGMSPRATENSARRVAAGVSAERNRMLPSQSAASIPPA